MARLWDTNTGEWLESFTLHQGYDPRTYLTAFAPDGHTFWIGNGYDEVQIWTRKP
jgi:hypothetical protein